MKKKVKAAIYTGLVLWIVAFFQIVTAKIFVNEDQMLEAFSRNQLMIQTANLEMTANLGQKTLDKKVVQNEFGNDTFVNIVTRNGQNYAHIQCQMNNKSDSIKTFYHRMNELCENSKIREYEIRVVMEGSLNDILNQEEKEQLCKMLENSMAASRIETLNQPGYYVAYSFCPGLTGNRRNLTIAITENEEENSTKVLMGTPIISEF